MVIDNPKDCSAKKGNSRVASKLGLSPFVWAENFGNATVVDFGCVGCSSKTSTHNSDDSPEVLTHTWAVVKRTVVHLN